MTQENEETLNIPRSVTNCMKKMADIGGDVNPPKKIDAREKLRVVRERQAEERLRRLEELKKHALEAQQMREQKELERRRRMEDLRQKENEKRSQVEERKRQIWEAEKERREAIVRKNLEREARIETKRKNERSSIVFAFGSSTPRLLETTDSVSFWGPRRATSTANLRLFPTTTPTVSLSRRPSERELEPKKRASSAGGLHRNQGDLMSTSMYEVFHWEAAPQKPPRLSLAPLTDSLLSNIDDSPSSPQNQNSHQTSNNYSHAVAGDSDGSSVMSASQIRIGRRKTDLMPTIPSPREGTNSRPTSGTRSLVRTPGRAYSMARLDILAQPRVIHSNNFSQPLAGSSKSMSRSTNHLVESKEFQSNTLTKTDTSKSMVQLHTKGSPVNFIQPRMTRAQRLRNRAKAIAASTKSLSPDGGFSSGDTTPSRPGSVLSQCSLTSASSPAPVPAPRLRSTARRPRPFSIHITGVSKEKEMQKIGSPSEENSTIKETKTAKTPAIKQIIVKKIQQKNDETNIKVHNIGNNNKVNGNSLGSNNKAEVTDDKNVNETSKGTVEQRKEINVVNIQKQNEKLEATENQTSVSVSTKIEQQEKKELSSGSDLDAVGNAEEDIAKGNAMSRSKITTEEEAKAALAERRRVAREQAEKEAEAERLRLEMEAKMEEERLRREEEEQRLAEEEQLRLLDEARRAEEDRLAQAILEAKKREEEEREQRQQEELVRLEKEEAERKAREEAERQRIEMVERLKREEEERQARRKRVEAIMKRTRNNPANSTNKADSEKNEDDTLTQEKDVSKNKLEVFLHGERLSSERSLTNGQDNQDNLNVMLHSNLIDNNHTNGVEITTSSLEKEDCLNSNSNSTLVTPLIGFQGKTKDTPVAANYMA